MRILFIGESWLGSCARSLKEALARRPDIELDEFSEDTVFPGPKARWLRAVGRLLYPFYRRDFNRQVLARVRALNPDMVVTYKGAHLHSDVVRDLKGVGVFTVNVYPDYSPHAYGVQHRAAVGEYDLVISTKAYHPSVWATTYGYANTCVFVPQGYDPLLHLIEEPPSHFTHDVVMVATYRAEYGELLGALGRLLPDTAIRVCIGGYGWDAVRDQFPSHWEFPGSVHGKAYLSLLRSGRICIAPLTREVMIDGRPQPGDVDTTRTYELAAAHCFFLHRRTEFAMALYERDEVPMYENAEELSALIRHYLANEKERERCALAAHRRAVPAYSLDARAAEIVELVRHKLGRA